MLSSFQVPIGLPSKNYEKEKEEIKGKTFLKGLTCINYIFRRYDKHRFFLCATEVNFLCYHLSYVKAFCGATRKEFHYPDNLQT